MNIPKEIKELEELCKPIVEYLEKNHNPHCQIFISSDSIKLLSAEIGIPIKKNKIPCDGRFSEKQTFHPPCKGKAELIARSNIDPIGCVYYCCNHCRYSYEKEGFIIEKL